ncbi:hypothetical protein HMPREF9374_2659 [Desmospora sp. 8437]|uniref:Uncharacterized protein n=1 Tax=Kroppenstedtia eburnea TaxID=714067 RepID=A0A1N7MS65_9BACL|nr:hypothetical protein HMPREF9374_2659 [Desmospora sp. 8437]SIS88868.1 hypothetical protein SAMN05421790_1072 [Kroppenstedtia eburnea]
MTTWKVYHERNRGKTRVFLIQVRKLWKKGKCKTVAEHMAQWILQGYIPVLAIIKGVIYYIRSPRE